MTIDASEIAEHYVRRRYPADQADGSPAWALICDVVEDLEDDVEAYAIAESGAGGTFALLIGSRLGAVLVSADFEQAETWILGPLRGVYRELQSPDGQVKMSFADERVEGGISVILPAPPVRGAIPRPKASDERERLLAVRKRFREWAAQGRP
jgi:hypothetical protein